MSASEPGESAESPRTILVIEDEKKIRDVVRTALAEPTDRWLEASTGTHGIELATAEQPTLVILDLGLPDLDGLEVCRRLRHRTSAPIVVLSARQAESEKVALLDAGADDYVTKPFGLGELQARVRAQLRRVRQPTERATEQPLVLGDVIVDLRRRSATRGGRPLHLTPIEWSLLTTLATSPGRTFTHEQLFDAVWGQAFGQPQQYLRVHITHLRKKIEAEPFAPRHIVTEPGVGYRFVADR